MTFHGVGMYVFWNCTVTIKQSVPVITIIALWLNPTDTHFSLLLISNVMEDPLGVYVIRYSQSLVDEQDCGLKKQPFVSPHPLVENC